MWNLGFSKALDPKLYSPGPGSLTLFLSSIDCLLLVPKPNAAAVVFVNNWFGSYAPGSGPKNRSLGILSLLFAFPILYEGTYFRAV
jgi:hypothetical protein